MDGYCECGAPGELMLDPYALNVNGEEIPVILCDDCAQNRFDDT
jgi:hypothetical protein